MKIVLFKSAILIAVLEAHKARVQALIDIHSTDKAIDVIKASDQTQDILLFVDECKELAKALVTHYKDNSKVVSFETISPFTDDNGFITDVKLAKETMDKAEDQPMSEEDAAYVNKQRMRNQAIQMLMEITGMSYADAVKQAEEMMNDPQFDEICKDCEEEMKEISSEEN